MVTAALTEPTPGDRPQQIPLSEESDHPAQHFGDLLVVDLGDHVQVTGAPLLFPLTPAGAQLLLGVAQARGLLEVLGVDRRLLVPAGGRDRLVELAQGRGAVIRRIRIRAPASSMRSMALSGRNRSEM